MTKRDYLKLTKSNTNILELKNIILKDKDVLSHDDCLILIDLYRVIIEKQNNKIKTLKKRRDKWKYIATSDNIINKTIDNISINLDNKDKKNIYKYLYNSSKESSVRLIKLENKRLKQEIVELKEKLL